MARDFDDDVRGLLCFLAGMGVGAVVALLFAPQSGKETRRLIAKKAEKSREYFEDIADDLRDRGRDLYERGKELAKDAGESASDLVDRGRKFVRG
jgi:gas vesicle protein